jgi:hypothetical protein
MKQWVCIDNKGYEEELVLNKTYIEIESGYADPFCVLIKNERGIVSEYYQPLTKTHAKEIITTARRLNKDRDKRDKQINKILDGTK